MGAYGYDYIIVMKENEKVELHTRTSEPCYGGLRKYKSTHGKEATQPEQKPGDLRHKFPKGEPIALAVRFPSYALDEYKTLLDYIWGLESPWIKGFGSPNDIIKTYSDKGNFEGVILLQTDIDPTVMVNLLKFTRSTLENCVSKFNSLIKEGCTPFEALTAVRFTNTNSYSINFGDNYMCNPKVNLKKFKEGVVNDFSNGTFRQRFDYSRRNIQDIFKHADGVLFPKELEKELGKPYAVDVKEYAAAVKKVVQKYV